MKSNCYSQQSYIGLHAFMPNTHLPAQPYNAEGRRTSALPPFPLFDLELSRLLLLGTCMPAHLLLELRPQELGLLRRRDHRGAEAAWRDFRLAVIVFWFSLAPFGRSRCCWNGSCLLGQAEGVSVLMPERLFRNVVLPSSPVCLFLAARYI